MRGKFLVPALAILAAAGWASAASVVVYSDFQSDGTSGTGSGWNVSGDPSGSPSGIAAEFTPGANYSLDSLKFDIALFTTPDSFDFELRDDNSGKPGTVLESWSSSLVVKFPNQNVVTLASVLNPTLTAGHTYWVDALPGSPGRVTNTAVWYFNNVGAIGIGITSDHGSTWTIENQSFDLAPTFEVDGSPVTLTSPVPTPTAAMAGVALMAIVASMRRFRKEIV